MMWYRVESVSYEEGGGEASVSACRSVKSSRKIVWVVVERIEKKLPPLKEYYNVYL